MSNGFIFVAIGCFAVVSVWSIFISIALDKANKQVEKLKQELLDTIPF